MYVFQSYAEAVDLFCTTLEKKKGQEKKTETEKSQRLEEDK